MGVLPMLALCLAGCGAGVRKDAAGDVGAFLAAVASDDAAAIERHIDRKALRADLKAQLLEVPEVRDLHAQMGAEVGDVAVDRMIAPQAKALALAGPMLGVTQPADSDDVVRQLKVIDSHRVCLLDPGVRDLCMLTFAKQAKSWRLVKMHAQSLAVQVAAPSGVLAAPPPDVTDTEEP